MVQGIKFILFDDTGRKNTSYEKLVIVNLYSLKLDSN